MIPGELREALKSAVSPVLPRNYDYVPDQINVPCAVVGNPTMTFDEAQNRGLDMAEIDVLVIVSRMNERGAQTALNEYLAGSGVKSVKAALEADRTLDGACADLRVRRASPITIEQSGVQYFAYRYEVDIYG